MREKGWDSFGFLKSPSTRSSRLTRQADQVLAAKTGRKKVPLAILVPKEQVGEVKRIVEEMQKRLLQLKKPIHGEATQKDQDRIKLKTDQINNLLFFIKIASRLLGIKTEPPKTESNAH
ncbi:hypothetical protein M3Y98_00549200 [Aphelenchoides besseyi]|nr:hypothetical protein M3Y98_00549200 [Aphelenchoides besseyi]